MTPFLRGRPGNAHSKTSGTTSCTMGAALLVLSLPNSIGLYIGLLFQAGSFTRQTFPVMTHLFVHSQPACRIVCSRPSAPRPNALPPKNIFSRFSSNAHSPPTLSSLPRWIPGVLRPVFLECDVNGGTDNSMHSQQTPPPPLLRPFGHASFFSRCREVT